MPSKTRNKSTNRKTASQSINSNRPTIHLVTFLFIAAGSLLSIWQVGNFISQHGYVEGIKTVLQQHLQPKVDLIIEHATVVTMDPSNTVIQDGWIAIKDTKIIGIGKNTPPYQTEEIWNAQGKIALPGLINTHSHTGLTVLRGHGSGLEFTDWAKSVSKQEAKLTPEDVQTSSLLGIAEMIKSGTVTFNDMYFFPEQTEEAISQSGVRGFIRLSIKSTPQGITIETPKNSNHELIRYTLAPNPLTDYSTSDLKKIQSFAQTNNLPIHVHFESDGTDKGIFNSFFHTTPTLLLKNTNILNTRTILAHGVFLTDAEIAEIARYPKVSISANPISEQTLSNKSTPIGKLLAAGVNVSLGTDGAAGGYSLDLFNIIRYLATADSNCSSPKPFCVNNRILPEFFLRMATINGAKALGINHSTGSLEIGKSADIILVDTHTAHLTPSSDPFSLLVFSANGSDVTDTIIAGKIIMRERQLRTIKETDIIQKAKEIALRLANQKDP